ncbi:MAG: glycosyltransferase family 4 protein [Prevotella sp.]|nr:glycosyltransferase family 4 protein [Prevotella sp.]
MMKIGFYYINELLSRIDCTQLLKGNPGISGTAYMFGLISTQLAERDNGIEVTYYAPHTVKGSRRMYVEKVNDVIEAYHKAEAVGLDYLVIKNNDADLLLDAIPQTSSQTRIVVWCHNFLNQKELNRYSRCSLVARIINVGREQMDVYRDHAAFRKSDYIYNTVQIDQQYLDGLTPVVERDDVVTYMGCVIPSKGLHVLAEAWPEVLRQKPNAQLYVIGTGALYGDITLGKWGLAEPRYERYIMKYLSRDGQLLPGVHLMGIMGNEKYDILRQTKVGVPNPTGNTETFCVSAVEMQMLGIRIVSKRCAGYLDTVRNGILVRKERQLAHEIIRRLDAGVSSDDSQTYFAQHFAPQTIICEWERLFLETIGKDEHLHPILPLSNPDFEWKATKERLRRLKLRFPWLESLLPTVNIFVDLNWKVNSFLGKLKRRLTGDQF